MPLLFDERTHTYSLDGNVLINVTDVLEAAGLIDYSWIPPATRQMALDRGRAVHQATAFDDEGDLDVGVFPMRSEATWKGGGSSSGMRVRSANKSRRGGIIRPTSTRARRTGGCDCPAGPRAPSTSTSSAAKPSRGYGCKLPPTRGSTRNRGRFSRSVWSCRATAHGESTSGRTIGVLTHILDFSSPAWRFTAYSRDVEQTGGVSELHCVYPGAVFQYPVR